MEFVRSGDPVIVHSMDRVARNLDDLRRIVQTLTEKAVRIDFVKEHVSFTGEDSPMATFMLSVMGAFAEVERALLKERQHRDEIQRLDGYHGFKTPRISEIRDRAANQLWQQLSS